jgi:hypothetical protein
MANISKISAKAVLSPWIRQLGIKQRISNFLNCPNCGLGFFSYRYNDEEMHCIYRDYRGERYVAIRNRWERWYDINYNANHDNEAWVAMRIEALTNFINKFELKPNVVVDVGGDRGQYIPNLGQQVSFVIDKSYKEPVKGVITSSLLSEVYKPDLIFLSHVLEHVANPVATLKELLSYSNTIYVEVPCGVPEISKKRRSKIRFLIKLVSTVSPLFWRRFTIPATGRKSGNGVLIQSEHINFFTETSLVTLAKMLGSKIELEVNEIATPDGNRARVIQCLLFAHD